MAWRWRVLALATPALGLAAPAVACTAPAGFTPSTEVIAASPREGDLALTDGAPLRLAGLVLLPEDLPPAASLLARLSGELRIDRASRDRWGRHSALLAQAGNAAFGAEILLESGLAMADPSGLPQDCRLRLLQAERRGRDRGAGLWARPATAALDPADATAALARLGRFAVLEGRIISVGLTRRAAFLNFGPPGRAVSVELPLAAWRALERQGWTRTGLRGHKVTARGVILEASPARLLAGSADAIELER